MKILFWTDGFWPRIGGIETQGVHFVEELHKRGHQCTVLAQKDEPSWKDEETYQGISIRRFDWNSIFPKRELKHLVSIEKHLEWVMKEFQPNLIHLNACNGWSALVFLLFRKKIEIPCVVTVHSPFFYKNETNPLLEQISLHARGICCVSEWVFHATAKLIPHLQEKLRRIYNGLPLPFLQPKPLPFSPPIFMLIGRFTAEKGFETALLGFALFQEKFRSYKARLLLVGDGEERFPMENLVQILGIQDCVEFIGSKAKEEIASLINQSTVVLIPSYFESFGLVAVEAMQMGRPVIASAVGGLKEIVVDGKTGLLIPSQDPEALSCAMQQLLQNKEKTAQMGSLARLRAQEMFTLDQNVDQYEALYQELEIST